jgi:hypothetical protein
MITKGEWKRQDSYIYADTMQGKTIAKVYDVADTDETASVMAANISLKDAIDNANLIAAAPDLLEVLKEARVCVAQNMESHCLCGKPNQARQRILGKINKTIAAAENK